MAEDIEMFGVREVFQLLEHVLLSAGWNDIVMATDRGLFTWSWAASPTVSSSSGKTVPSFSTAAASTSTTRASNGRR